MYVIDADGYVGKGGTTFGEPSIAVNPADPNQIAVTRFPSAAAEWNNPADLLYSTDGGITWADEPTIPVPPGLGTATNNCPCDQTIDYGRDGTLYGAFLTNASQVVTGSTADPTKPSSWSWNTTAGTTQLTNATNTNADQPWLLVNRDPDHADQDNVYVGYEDLGTSTRPAQAHVAVSRNARPPDFTRDNSPGAVVTDTNTSGGIRLATDPRNGTIYALFQTQTTAGPLGNPQNITYRLNRSTDGGQTWTLGSNPQGIAIATADTHQGVTYKFGSVNALLGGVDHVAVDPTNGDVYVAYGVDVSGNNQIRMRRLTDDGAGGLTVGAEHTVSNSTNAALPSVAVLSDGTIGVLYLSSDGTNTSGFPQLSAHLARSTDHAATFTDTVLQSYTTQVGTAGNPKERLFGDYQQLKAVGTTFYGAFIGNLNGVNQTTAQPTDTIFFSVPQYTKSTLSASANPSVYGQPVSFTATVVPPPDGGTVTFKVDGTQLGSPVTVDTTTGTATSDSIATLSPGTHDVDAMYSGDPNYQGDKAMTLKQTVNTAAVATTLTSSGSPSLFGHSVTYTDTVCAAPPSTNPTAPPSGTVTVKDGSTLLGTGTLSPGGGANCSQAQVSFSSLMPGTHTINAQYSGDGNYLAGSVESITQTVSCTNNITGSPGAVFTSGESTCIVNATIGGTVHGAADGALFISNSTIRGSVLSFNGMLLSVCRSTVTGTVNVTGASGFVMVGDPGDDGCTGNKIAGSVLLGNNRSGLEVVANQVGGSVQVAGTTGTGPFPEDTRAEIEGNTIGGSLSCTGNTPAPTNDGNPNTVTGSRIGQCSSL
ncbi:Ig-like domain repeat protein [Streptomyces mirabilis]|uniref:Ig-like domain repeat protein n=1 Tax=Streptomyces mirabilis TaxID=68239 RepID=UPI0035E340BE